SSTTCATLAPNATCTLTGSYTVQQTDVDAGQVVNTATADSDETPPTTDEVRTAVKKTERQTRAKTVSWPVPDALNAVISYSVVATNSGTVTMYTLALRDALPISSSTTCATLAPNATCTLTGSYTVHQTDVDAGQVVNTATADSDETPPTTDEVTTPITQKTGRASCRERASLAAHAADVDTRENAGG